MMFQNLAGSQASRLNGLGVPYRRDACIPSSVAGDNLDTIFGNPEERRGLAEGHRKQLEYSLLTDQTS